jgi:SPP1 gp7 family putative phage head morphogenesis protein
MRRRNPNKPIVAEASYLRDLLVVVNRAIKHASPLVESIDNVYARLDTEEEALDYFDRQYEDMIRTFKYVDVPVSKHADQVSVFNKRNLYQRAEQFGISANALKRSEKGIERKLDVWAAQNVDLIETIPETYFDDIRLQVTAAIQNGVRAETLSRHLMERVEIPRNRAVLIARDQIGKLNADLMQSRNENLGIKGYIWRSVNDNRVRPEHQDRDGQSFLWSNPPSGGHPGEDIQCRCYADPDFSSIGA